MIHFHIAKGCAPTGQLLLGLLKKAGLKVSTAPVGPVEAHISWGVGLGKTAPAINANVGAFSKYSELTELAKQKVSCLEAHKNVPHDGYPFLGRRFQHHAGRDIVTCLQTEDAEAAKASGKVDFFTKYVPSSSELRVWIYRRRHLGTYKKSLKYTSKFRKVGRNYDNGYVFDLVSEAHINRDAVALAARAVDALGLDFGAVDMLVGKDGKLYVLEVNTAPGVESEGRQVIQALASKLAKWAQLKFPKRNGDKG